MSALTSNRYRWWHAAVVGAAANLASALPAGYNGDSQYYTDLRTPPGSPPDWLFAPAWGVNNVLTLVSNLRVANLSPSTPGRRSALRSEAATWVLFSSFSGLYFGLRSPVLGAVDTVAGLATTAHAVAVTSRVDGTAAWLLAPRLVWLGYASYVAVGTAIHNRDDLLDRGPFVRAGRARRLVHRRA